MTNNFNPIDYANDLDAARVPRDQAAAHVKALTNLRADVAFAADLAKVEVNLRQEIRQCEERLSLKIELVRTELDAKIEMLRAELTAKIETLRAELTAKIETVQAELILHRWIFGVLITLCSANLALTVKLLMREP
jgi:hypothetical protein